MPCLPTLKHKAPKVPLYVKKQTNNNQAILTSPVAPGRWYSMQLSPADLRILRSCAKLMITAEIPCVTSYWRWIGATGLVATQD
ncbi:hypothetical protein GDO78_022119 [Eleutherodactylus coqui]|uniref:Uncharacterized protein n=1 Tax=Eleutherodactylus coqui TaxID=57060 RepID=A0A8J6BGP4_ELECQ|nr:hypothetical protein GDO78_022119 [Eleutherodactylus coqui]